MSFFSRLLVFVEWRERKGIGVFESGDFVGVRERWYRLLFCRIGFFRLLRLIKCLHVKSFDIASLNLPSRVDYFFHEFLASFHDLSFQRPDRSRLPKLETTRKAFKTQYTPIFSMCT